MSEFETKGYFKDYYVNGKFVGSKECEKDREEFGYFGRKNEILCETINFKSKKIKAGTEVMTELQRICGKVIVPRETVS